MASTPLNFTNLLNNKSAFNDLNEPHLTYDFPASQYHSPYEDCTYEETPTSEVYTNEETPRAPNSKKAQRQANFTIEEDKLLVSAWLNIGLDPVKGADQKKKQFWKRITDYFEKHKKWSAERSEKSLTNRWSTISSTVSKFCGHYAQIEHLRKSGYTEQDKQKWMDEHQKIESKRKWKAPSSKVADSINLEDDDTEAPEPASLKRPIGRKAAKEAIKKAKSKEQVGENENESSKTCSELEELRARRLESDRIKAEQFKLLLATEQKQVALREKEIELQTRSEDAKIMSMDTSVMPPFQAEYFISLQKEILAKRASRNENQ